MKKIISSFIILAITLTVSCFSFKTISKAENYNEDIISKETIAFDEKNYEELSNDKIYEEKIKKLNISPSFSKIIELQMYDDICNAKEIILENSYYIGMDDGTMIQTTEENYLSQVKNNKKVINEMDQYMRNKLSNGISLLTVIGSPGNTKKINGGTLNLGVILITNDGKNYSCGCIFDWETMPNARYKDAIGLTRDGTTSVVPQSACGTVIYSYNYRYMDGTNYVSEKKEETKETSFNQLKASSSGYAFDFQMGVNSSDQNYPYRSVYYTNMVGSIYYKGMVNNSSIKSVNHWATYAHKKIGIISSSIDFSIPFNAGFKVSVGFVYSQLVDEHLWRL